MGVSFEGQHQEDFSEISRKVDKQNLKVDPILDAYAVSAIQTVIRAVDDTWSYTPAQNPILQVSRRLVCFMMETDIQRSLISDEAVIHQVVHALPSNGWWTKESIGTLDSPLRANADEALARCEKNINFLYQCSHSPEESDTDSEDLSSQQKFRVCYENCLRKKGISVKKRNRSCTHHQTQNQNEGGEQSQFYPGPLFVNDLLNSTKPPRNFVYYQMDTEDETETSAEDDLPEWEKFKQSHEAALKNANRIDPCSPITSEECEWESSFSPETSIRSSINCVSDISSSDEFTTTSDAYKESDGCYSAAAEMITEEDKTKHLEAQFNSCSVCQKLLNNIISALRNCCDSCLYSRTYTGQNDIQCKKCLLQIAALTTIQKKHCFQLHNSTSGFEDLTFALHELLPEKNVDLAVELGQSTTNHSSCLP